MKLNIGELVQKADLSTMTADAHCREDYWTATRAEIEAFAGLIVERCAVESWNHYMDTCTKNNRSASMWHEWCASTAIRNLMED